MMLKTWPLCTDAKLNHRISAEVKKNGFISLPGKGGHSRPMPSKTVFPNPGGPGEEFYSNGSRAGLPMRIRMCAKSVFL